MERITGRAVAAASVSRRKKTQKARPVAYAAAPKKRLTLLMPAVLDRNLEIFSAKEGTLKTYVIIDALTEFLTKRGVQPDKVPKISW